MKRLPSIYLLYCALAVCARAATLWLEGFEDTFPPANWIENSVDPSTTYAFNGAFSAKLGAAADALTTPKISSAETLIFWSYTTSADPDIIVEYAAATSGPWTEFPESPISGYTQQWNGQFVDLTGRGNLYVRFSKSGTGTLYIDDIQLDDGTITSSPPTLNPIGNRSVTENNALTFSVSATETDGDPATLSAENLPPGATFASSGSTGVFEWVSAAPTGVYASTFYAVDKDGMNSETITIRVEESPSVLISEIADPAGTGGGDFRFVELYNAGNESAELSGWTLRKQINGGSWVEIPLTNRIAANSTYVIAYSAPDFYDAYGTVPDLESSAVSGNGDDGYFLYKGDILVDSFGEPGRDGTDTAWDYEDCRAERKPHILTPRPDWSAEEWIIAADAEDGEMSPGAHGPLPQFENLADPFVFLGDDLELTVTAVNTVRTDIITLSAKDLPANAGFASAIGTNRVSSTLRWENPPEGIYSAILSAAGACGTNTLEIQIAVSDRAAIDGKFSGWKPGTIVKLDNGQFWKNVGGVGPSVAPSLRNPGITVTNWLGIQQRMIVDGLSGTTEVTQIAPSESAVTNTFTGLHAGNIYRLADGTTWEQISFENAPSSESSVTAWRLENTLIFVDRDPIEIGRCTVKPVPPPVDTTIRSRINGMFYGFRKGTFFHLANGSWWRQTSLDKSTGILLNPEVSLWNENGTDFLEMPAANQTVEVAPLSVQAKSTITNTFCGLHHGTMYELENSEQWMQISFENIGQEATRPAALLWTEGDAIFLLVRDERDREIGTCQVAAPTEDTDHDGTSNAAEALAGSNPLDGRSNFVISKTGTDDSDRTILQWNPVEGRTYSVEWTPSLTQPFQPLETSIPWPQDNWSNTNNTAGFYRVTVRPE